MIYGYARVSTAGQAKDGNSLEHQEAALAAAGAAVIIKEAYSGGDARPRLDALMAALAAGDTILITKLDRIARSAVLGLILINSLIERGITVHILNMGIMDNSPMGKANRAIFLAFAEFERDMIIQRTQEGKAIARTRLGYREGRPKKFTPEQLGHGVELLNNHSYEQVRKMTGISKSTLQRAKRTGRGV